MEFSYEMLEDENDIEDDYDSEEYGEYQCYSAKDCFTKSICHEGMKCDCDRGFCKVKDCDHDYECNVPQHCPKVVLKHSTSKIWSAILGFLLCVFRETL